MLLLVCRLPGPEIGVGKAILFPGSRRQPRRGGRLKQEQVMLKVLEKPEERTAIQVECLSRDQQCPMCGGDNRCRLAKGHLYKGLCWCEEIIVPSQILRALAADHFEPACLCRSCLETVARLSHELDDNAAVASKAQERPENSRSAGHEEDYYFEENGKLVFTATYHLRRGNCCGNGCRHCPF